MRQYQSITLVLPHPWRIANSAVTMRYLAASKWNQTDIRLQVSEVICDSSDSESVPVKRVPFRGWGDLWKSEAGTVATSIPAALCTRVYTEL